MSSTMTVEKGSFTFTVGKLDAGMAILIGSRAHLIEFPSILLPEGVTIGSIVSIDVHRNLAEEEATKSAFWKLQNDIYSTYGIQKPAPPQLQLRHTTQTSVTLEWPAIQLATASLRSLDIYRNGQRLANIPNPMSNMSTKLSGLSMNTPYTFQLVLRTTAGTFPSNLIQVKTHTLEDTSGISVCFGTILDSDVGGAGADARRDELKRALKAMGAKYFDKIQIDTTHFVCTTSLSLSAVSRDAREGAGSRAGNGQQEEPGVEYQKAVQLSIPIVQPDWVLACYYHKKMVPTAPYYLGQTVPPLQQGHARVQSVSARPNPEPPSSPQTGAAPSSSNLAKRQSVPTSSSRSNLPRTDALRESPSRSSIGTPPVRRVDSSSQVAKQFGAMASEQEEPIPTGQPRQSLTKSKSPPPAPSLPTTTAATNQLETIQTPDLPGDEDDGSPTTPKDARRRTGTMNKAFKFPPDATSPTSGKGKQGELRISPPPPLPVGPPIIVVHEAKDSIASLRSREPPAPASKVQGAQRQSPDRKPIEPPTPDLANGEGGGGLGRGRSGTVSTEGGDEFGEVDLS